MVLKPARIYRWNNLYLKYVTFSVSLAGLPKPIKNIYNEDEDYKFSFYFKIILKFCFI